MYKKFAFLIPIAYLSLGIFYPLFGYFLLVCMLTGVTMAYSKNRHWCGNLCPRGFLYDKLFMNNTRKVPDFLKSSSFKYGFFIMFMALFVWRLSVAGWDIYKIGSVFVLMGIVSGTIGLILGLLYRPRAWCLICPMGVMGNFAASLNRGPQPAVQFNHSECKKCKVCEKACPMDITITDFKDEIIDSQCMLCKKCVQVCPKKVLA
ncbi:4Fe-4S binding protein [Heliobacillus mobilis]|uniref:4Fe-4S binding protein n=1 Tax=Heliobacterium mobile TaxID=28064 RepID=A0A6I3SPR6_HELMO|nr:4Fe-4S binding protein [Heliobacterium mobile]MTV50685.1 4Fe-4S binding protein [Heliobacterium mobile]